jgi:hypothetical protein
MAKAGRKRKEGQRYDCGKLIPPVTLAKIKAIQAEKEAELKVVVLAQPHRRGDADQMRASVVGRFAIEHYADLGDRRVYYAAAEEYAQLVHRWRVAWGAPVDVNMGGGGTGAGPAPETVQGWWRQISRIDTALSRHGLTGPIKRMVVEDREQVFLDPYRVKKGLWIIASELGRIDPKGHPFH